MPIKKVLLLTTLFPLVIFSSAGFAEVPFPRELPLKLFDDTRKGFETTNETLEAWGYFRVPSFPVVRGGKTGFFSRLETPGDNRLPGTTASIKKFISDMTADGWVFIPPGKRIKIFYSVWESRKFPAWDYPEGMTFIHRIWTSGKRPFELRMLRRTANTWVFATFLAEEGRLKYLEDPSRSVHKITNAITNTEIPLVRETYPRCIRCHSANVGNHVYTKEKGHRIKEELGPCEFLPGNEALKTFLLKRFEEHPSFFECSSEVSDDLCNSR